MAEKEMNEKDPSSGMYEAILSKKFPNIEALKTGFNQGKLKVLIGAIFRIDMNVDGNGKIILLTGETADITKDDLDLLLENDQIIKLD